jgi:group II intron reverse transcriptase/maturase
MRQKSPQRELPFAKQGEALSANGSGETRSAAKGNGCPGTDRLMELAVERGNWKRAWKRVTKNKGSPGIDGMTVDELGRWLYENGETLRTQLLAGSFEPLAVRRVEIPKGGGGTRTLGIPTVRDRFVQQLILQVLQPLLDPKFSEHSHGFRPGRRAHDAICEAQQYILSGRHWVVDVDLEKFFDRVNHDVLMGVLAKLVSDTRLLRVVRRFLEAGMMADGVATERHEGTPQGGPLSPLLANVLLDVVDKELERRGHAFVRYADDCNVYVRSERAGLRVLEHLRGLFGKLRLRINESKSAVDRPWRRDFLGYSFWMRRGILKRRTGRQALATMKSRVRQLTARSGGRSMQSVVRDLSTYLGGIKLYWSLVETRSQLEHLDEWIAHRLRQIQLKQWKRPHTIYRELRARGLNDVGARRVAANARSWWLNSGKLINVALPSAHFERMGLPRLAM